MENVEIYCYIVQVTTPHPQHLNVKGVFDEPYVWGLVQFRVCLVLGLETNFNHLNTNNNQTDLFKNYQTT